MKKLLIGFILLSSNVWAEAPKCVLDYKELVQVNRLWHYAPSIESMKDKSAKWISSTSAVEDGKDFRCVNFPVSGTVIFSQEMDIPENSYYYFEGIGDDRVKVYKDRVHEDNLVINNSTPVSYFHAPVRLPKGRIKIVVELEDEWEYASGFMLSIRDSNGKILLNTDENWQLEEVK